MAPETKSPIGKRWAEAMRRGDPRELSELVVPDCIDEAIFCLLNAIDEGAIQLSYIAPNGEVTNLTTDGRGELAGWYSGPDSWSERYSSEVVNDYFK